MEMGKGVIMVMLAVVLAFCLTGCMEETVEQKISSNGKCSTTMTVYLEKAAITDYVNRKMGSDYLKTTEESLKEEGYTLQTIGGKEYYVSKPEVANSTIAKEAKNNQKEALKGEYRLWETGIYMNMKALGASLTEDSTMSGLLSGETTDEEMKEIYNNSYINYSVEFDYNVVKTDGRGTIDATNPKKVIWKMSFSDFTKTTVLEAYCKSGIKVSGVIQGATYGKAKKVKFSGVKTATYKGKKIKSNQKFKKHGQHTIVLKAANGERRTVTFFIDTKKPTISGIKNKKTYKKGKSFFVNDKDSGVASVYINGKKQTAGSTYFSLTKKGKNTIVVKDKAGNKKKIQVTIKKK